MIKNAVLVRKARIVDVPVMQKLLMEFAKDGRLLARSLSELYTNLRDMFVAVDANTCALVGCCGLHIIWQDLAEIRSLAVGKDRQGTGIGRVLVDACVEEARELGIGRLFTLTYETTFFEKVGFKVVDKNIFPQKIWADCLHCPKFPDCDEIALVLDVEIPEDRKAALSAPIPPSMRGNGEC